MPNELDSVIQKIIADSSAALAEQIGKAVRQTLAAEIAGAALLSAPKRPPGRPKGSVSKPAAAAPTAGKRKSSRRRTITQAELDAVLSVLQKTPGLTSVQLQKEAGIDAKQAQRVLGKLRESGGVKWKGTRSGATYTVA